jgi:hypothetical protein
MNSKKRGFNQISHHGSKNKADEELLFGGGSKAKDQGFTEDVDIGDTYEEQNNDLTLANEAEVDDDIVEDDIGVDGDESDPEDAEDLDENLEADYRDNAELDAYE